MVDDDVPLLDESDDEALDDEKDDDDDEEAGREVAPPELEDASAPEAAASEEDAAGRLLACTADDAVPTLVAAPLDGSTCDDVPVVDVATEDAPAEEDGTTPDMDDMPDDEDDAPPLPGTQRPSTHALSCVHSRELLHSTRHAPFSSTSLEPHALLGPQPAPHAMAANVTT